MHSPCIVLLRRRPPPTPRGGSTWLKPRYVQLFKHKLPNGQVIRTLGGTQIIDRAWRFLRAHIGSRNGMVGTQSVQARGRSAQWTYWHRGANLWLATGEMLATLRPLVANLLLFHGLG